MRAADRSKLAFGGGLPEPLGPLGGTLRCDTLPPICGVAESPQRFLWLELGARMTVIRLAGPRLFVHSPVAAATELVREVQALGPVAYIVAPNRLHHPTNEVVFFQRPSATLVASDLAFNVGSSSPALTRIAFRMSGAYGRLAPTFLERLLVRDRAALRRSLTRVLEWPFERVIVAHGEVLEGAAEPSLHARSRGFSGAPPNKRDLLSSGEICDVLTSERHDGTLTS